jgi:hypothetical protein
MAEKRAKKATEEAKEAQANEQIRRKSAKVGAHQLCVNHGAELAPKDVGKLREEVKAKESMKDMEKKKQGKASLVPREFLGF